MNDVLNRFRTWDGFSFGNVALTDRGQLMKGCASPSGKTKREMEIEKGRMKKAGNPIEAAAAKQAKAQGMPGYKSKEGEEKPTLMKASPFRETGDDWFNKAAVTDTGVLVDASGIIEDNRQADELEKATIREAYLEELAKSLPLLKNDEEAGKAAADMAAKIKKGNPKLSDEDAKKMAEKAVSMRKKHDDDEGEDDDKGKEKGEEKTEKSNGDDAGDDDEDKPPKPEKSDAEKEAEREAAKASKPSAAKPPAGSPGMGE